MGGPWARARAHGMGRRMHSAAECIQAAECNQGRMHPGRMQSRPNASRPNAIKADQLFSGSMYGGASSLFRTRTYIYEYPAPGVWDKWPPSLHRDSPYLPIWEHFGHISMHIMHLGPIFGASISETCHFRVYTQVGLICPVEN